LVLVAKRIGSEAIVGGETKLGRVIGLDTHLNLEFEARNLGKGSCLFMF